VEVKRLQRELYFGLLGECEERLAKGEEENGCWMEEVVKRSEEFGMVKGSLLCLMEVWGLMI